MGGGGEARGGRGRARRGAGAQQQQQASRPPPSPRHNAAAAAAAATVTATAVARLKLSFCGARGSWAARGRPAEALTPAPCRPRALTTPTCSPLTPGGRRALRPCSLPAPSSSLPSSFLSSFLLDTHCCQHTPHVDALLPTRRPLFIQNNRTSNNNQNFSGTTSTQAVGFH